MVLLDTGLGRGGAATEDWYRPRRVPLPEALGTVGVVLNDIEVVVNCHLHFDHCGGNPMLAGRSVLCQRQELAVAQAGNYTIDHLVDYPGSRYDLFDGEAEIWPGLHVIPTPGHVAGHQSLVAQCEDGSVVLAGHRTTPLPLGVRTYSPPPLPHSVTANRCRMPQRGCSGCWPSIRSALSLRTTLRYGNRPDRSVRELRRSDPYRSPDLPGKAPHAPQ